MRAADTQRTLAQDLYRRLAQQGFTPAQVVDVATRLLDHVQQDLRAQRPDTDAHRPA